MAASTYDTYDQYHTDINKLISIPPLNSITNNDINIIKNTAFKQNAPLQKYTNGKTFKEGEKDTNPTYRVVVAYLTIKYSIGELGKLTPMTGQPITDDNKAKIQVYYQAISKALTQLSDNIFQQAGGKKRKQKGGMDTAKIYNAQGLVQELSALNQNDTVSPAVLFPSPFSASSLTANSGANDALPAATVSALMPPIPVPQAGGKKKVKSPKRK